MSVKKNTMHRPNSFTKATDGLFMEIAPDSLVR